MPTEEDTDHDVRPDVFRFSRTGFSAVHLGQLQDRIDFPSTTGQIWEVFLGDVRNLIEIEVCALFLVDDATHEFALEYVFPENRKTI